MPGFFEALENFNPKEPPKPTVEIQGKKLEVTPEVFQKVQKHGAENFELKNGKISLKSIFIIGKTYEILVKADKGYDFHDHDPYYPRDIVEGGFAWQIKSE
jgi:hypothetical protein